MDFASALKWLVTVSFIFAGLGVLFLMGYPSIFRLGGYDESEAERAAAAESDRRYHRIVNRGMSISISVITGVAATFILAGPAEDRSSGIIMAVVSLASAAVFVLLIRRGRGSGDRLRSPGGRVPPGYRQPKDPRADGHEQLDD